MKKYRKSIIHNLIGLLLFVASGFNGFSQNFDDFKIKAEQGDIDAQYNLGKMYYNGDGTLKDDKQAFYWNKKSAEQGQVDAQYSLALMYYNGIGTLKDYKKAAYWTRKSYEKGHKDAKELWEEYELWKY